MSANYSAQPVTGTLTVTTAAQALASAPADSWQRAANGILVGAFSTNSVSVFVGGSDVTTSNGIELVAGEKVVLPFADPSKVYVICASSSPVIRFMY